MEPKILIVEDEAVSAMLLEMNLQHAGYRSCPLAGTASEAVEIASREKPALVLMDINLPGGRSGIEAAREIHAKFGIPSIFVSAYPRSEMLESLGDCPHAGYITKPFSFPELDRLIRTVLPEEA